MNEKSNIAANEKSKFDVSISCLISKRDIFSFIVTKKQWRFFATIFCCWNVCVRNDHIHYRHTHSYVCALDNTKTQTHNSINSKQNPNMSKKNVSAQYVWKIWLQQLVLNVISYHNIETYFGLLAIKEYQENIRFASQSQHDHGLIILPSFKLK